MDRTKAGRWWADAAAGHALLAFVASEQAIHNKAAASVHTRSARSHSSTQQRPSAAGHATPGLRPRPSHYVLKYTVTHLVHALLGFNKHRGGEAGPPPATAATPEDVLQQQAQQVQLRKQQRAALQQLLDLVLTDFEFLQHVHAAHLGAMLVAEQAAAVYPPPPRPRPPLCPHRPKPGDHLPRRKPPPPWSSRRLPRMRVWRVWALWPRTCCAGCCRAARP